MKIITNKNVSIITENGTTINGKITHEGVVYGEYSYTFSPTSNYIFNYSENAVLITDDQAKMHILISKETPDGDLILLPSKA